MIRKVDKKPDSHGGFTIIEVIIVLAIAGLILAMVFLAVPQLQMSQRDSQRREYAQRLMAAEFDFYSRNHKYPVCANNCTAQDADDASRFITSYMPEGNDPSTGLSYADSSVVVDSGLNVHTTTNTVYYLYNLMPVNHNQAPSVGQILIVAGHWCYDSQPDGNNTLIAGPGINYNKVVILIGIEKGDYYCLDNYSP